VSDFVLFTIRNSVCSSAVDGVFGGDVVDNDTDVLGVVLGLQALVFFRTTTSNHTDSQDKPNYLGKRTFISPTGRKFHTGYGTAVRSVSFPDKCSEFSATNE
jgi:hypothetical protein